MFNYKSTYKSTDNEIVKALREMTERGFETISYVDLKKNGINVITITDILDLTSRLQAENERLNKANTSVVEHLKKARRQIKAAKAEAYKECIEKVKEISSKTGAILNETHWEDKYTITEGETRQSLKRNGG